MQICILNFAIENVVLDLELHFGSHNPKYIIFLKKCIPYCAI